MRIFFSKKLGFAVLPLTLAILFSLFMELPSWGASLQEIQKRGVLKVGMRLRKTYEDAFAFYNRNGETQGLEVDLAKYIAEAAGVGFRMVILPWKDGIVSAWDPAFTWDRFDIAISTITITPERSTVCDFSIPYFSTGQVVTVRKNSGILVIEQLRGRAIGSSAVSTSAEVAKRFFGDTMVVLYPDIEHCIIALEAGNVDAIVTDFAPMAENPRVQDETFLVLPKSLSRENYGVAMEKGKKSLKALVDKVITKHEDKLAQKWIRW